MEESFSLLEDLIGKGLLIAGASNREVTKNKVSQRTKKVQSKTEKKEDESKSLSAPEIAALTAPDFVRIEKNIAAFGFFTPSSKRIKNVAKVIKFTQTIDGNRVEAEVKISPNIEYGIPITADQDKYLAFQKIIERSKREKGRVENPITFSSAELIKLLGQSDAGLNFREVYEWLDLMQGTQIKSQGAVWIAGKKRFATDVFNLFSRIKRVGDELDNGTVADKNYVWLSDWYLENLNAHYLLPVDFESYKQLKNNISKALIPLLQVWLYASRETGTFEKRYSEVCQVLNIKNYTYISDIKRFFGRSLDELVRHGYLSNWEVKKTSDGKDYKIVFRHGYKFYADRNAVKHLSGRKGKRSEISPVEPRKIQNRAELPKNEKEVAKAPNFVAEEVLASSSGTAPTQNLPDAVTAEQRELVSRLHLEYQISFEKAYELATRRQAETARQIEAFPLREIMPNNRAGFLIEAIEQSYSLPDAYFEQIKEREVSDQRKAKQSQIDDCLICDERGWRNVKNEMDTFYGVMHQCTHDAEIENQLEDHIV
ncbi:MAG: replication initiator protein A [Pyrinomonadaceae bacterium]